MTTTYKVKINKDKEGFIDSINHYFNGHLINSFKPNKWLKASRISCFKILKDNGYPIESYKQIQVI